MPFLLELQLIAAADTTSDREGGAGAADESHQAHPALVEAQEMAAECRARPQDAAPFRVSMRSGTCSNALISGVALAMLF